MLVLPELHPVPDIKGGSVELLVTNMLRENEKYNELRFIVISIYDEYAVKYHFKNSKIYYYRDGWFDGDLVKGKKFLWELILLFKKKERSCAKRFSVKQFNLTGGCFSVCALQKRNAPKCLCLKTFIIRALTCRSSGILTAKMFICTFIITEKKF